MAPKKIDTIDPGTLAVDYGFALSVMNSSPELKKIFSQAVAGTWTTDRFTAALRGTNWFKTTSDTAREWIIEQASDPKTAKQRLAARVATMKTEAGALGISASPAQLAQMAANSIMFGWTDPQVRASFAQGYRYNAKTPTAGLAGQTIDKINQASSDYLVPISDAAKQAWTQRVLAGTASADDFTEYAKAQAKSMFPTLASSIDKGITVQQYADPYKQTAATLLGVNPNDIDFTHDKWRAALDSVDPKSKERVPLSLADWSTKLKTDSQYGYDTSQDARNNAADFNTKILTTFGAM